MIKKKFMSQCISSDYCQGWNDAVDSIVRCKDCKQAVIKSNKEVSYCRYWGDLMENNEFCSKGERKDDGREEI